MPIGATPLDQQRAIMAQRMAQRTTPQGAPPGGLSGGLGSPPPPNGSQQPLGGAPQTSRLEPLLQQVMQILVEGNPADLEAFGKFMAQLQQLAQEHNMGQGTPQAAPTAGAQPSGTPPQF